MTAVDAAVQSRKLGAEVVTIVYRRGPGADAGLDATSSEWAQLNGVTIRTWSVLKSLEVADGAVVGATFAYGARRRRPPAGDRRDLVDAGRHRLQGDRPDPRARRPDAARPCALRGGRIEVDAEGRTSLPGVWAGGDCTFGGQDLTVEAVEHGKIAAHSIDRALAQMHTQPGADYGAQ